MLFPKGTAPHEVSAGFVITVGEHTQFFLTEGRPVLINGYRVWYRLRASAFIVKVDKSLDLPVFQETVSRIVVHGGIKADIFCGNRGHMLFQFMEGNQEADGIVAFSTCKAQDERYIYFQFGVITGELKECIAEVILFQVAVPSPGSIGIRKMAHSIRGAVPVVPARAGVGVYGSAVTGDRVVLEYK